MRRAARGTGRHGGAPDQTGRGETDAVENERKKAFEAESPAWNSALAEARKRLGASQPPPPMQSRPGLGPGQNQILTIPPAAGDRGDMTIRILFGIIVVFVIGFGIYAIIR